MEIQLSFFFATFLFFLFLLAKQYYNKHRTVQKLPPGPWKLPFIGNLHQLVGSLPHRSLKKLSEKYGPIMHLQVGELQTIVVSSARIAEETLKTNGLIFADRPQLLLTKIMFYNFSDLGSSPYGEHWRQMRKLCVMELLSPKKVQSFQNIMEEEFSSLVSRIQSSEGVPINLTDNVLEAESAIICRAAVGRRCSDQKALITLAKETASFAGIFNVGDIFPSLKFLDSLFGSKRKLVNMHKKVDIILENIIREHEEDRLSPKRGQTSDQSSEEDLLDVFLRLKDSRELQVSITRENIKANILELFSAGIETSSMAIEWTMAAMMKHPRVMEKAQAEVRKAFKGKKKISDCDVQSLSYLKMVTKETLRLYPPGPLLGPRISREKCTIGGYDIPANTIAVINGWAIGRDTEFWDNPDVYEPERFSNISTSYTGAHFELIPFGAGRRICPGISLSIAGIELSLAYLLYHFDWKLPGEISPEEFDMTEKFGAAAGRKHNLCLIPTSHVID
ncbi:premnaspirodiene oxygenase-like [Olea europaea subsp. europaea]|uniref:Premnaspirodiene oxygenase-like n=2 Tax=Olea europaea subsp. europaea TaxID=158383 RepID=A0A8S0T5P5_OLEEU|nr:premnaspirodiene oxygenase-like [Olea europaea subsp. europaea]